MSLISISQPPTKNRSLSPSQTSAAMEGAKQAYRDSVGIEDFRGRYRLNLSRKYSRQYYGKDQKRISTGLSANAENFAILESKCYNIHLDIQSSNFDPTLAKYGLGDLTNESGLVVIPTPKALTLVELWDKYCEVRKPDLAVTSYKGTFRGEMLSFARRIPFSDPNKADEIKSWLLANTTPKQAKRVLSYLSLSCDWAVKRHHLVENPFSGLAASINTRRTTKDFEKDIYSDDDDGLYDCRAFTREERDTIIAEYDRSGYTRHLVPFVKFLFWTGCRPGEAAGLKWKDIKEDFSELTFQRSYNHQTQSLKCTKTGVVRQLPCTPSLTNLLRNLHKPEFTKDDFVFSGKFGHRVNTKQFQLVWRGNEKKRYKGVVYTLAQDGKISCYLKPYSTRHTFITLQIKEAGVPVDVVASWVGNSAKVIWDHYCDVRAQDWVPKDI